MSCQLRWDQCCSEDGCNAPARYGDLCTRCLMAATPARRAVEMMANDLLEAATEAASSTGFMQRLAESDDDLDDGRAKPLEAFDWDAAAQCELFIGD